MKSASRLKRTEPLPGLKRHTTMQDTIWILMPPSTSRDAVETVVRGFGFQPLIFENPQPVFEELSKHLPLLFIVYPETVETSQPLLRVMRDIQVKRIVVVDFRENGEQLEWRAEEADDFLIMPMTVSSAKHMLSQHVLTLESNPKPQLTFA